MDTVTNVLSIDFVPLSVGGRFSVIIADGLQLPSSAIKRLFRPLIKKSLRSSHSSSLGTRNKGEPRVTSESPQKSQTTGRHLFVANVISSSFDDKALLITLLTLSSSSEEIAGFSCFLIALAMNVSSRFLLLPFTVFTVTALCLFNSTILADSSPSTPEPTTAGISVGTTLPFSLFASFGRISCIDLILLTSADFVSFSLEKVSLSSLLATS
mmetsp:Transcript_17984/g.27275  ORF Transcript_17984/g.27275 Transcript_17984/m.27275 type:complete len:212 (-) Transcript_17984:5081-5716(-)